MPGLMSRASTVVKARISKLLDRAEDPLITLDYSYEKQRELLVNVKKGIADVVTAKKRIDLQSTKPGTEVAKLEGQARQALSGRDDLARTALERKTAVQAQLQSLDQQGAQLEAQQEKLVESEKGSPRRSRRSGRRRRRSRRRTRRRGAGQDRRGRHGDRRWPTPASRSSGATRPSRCRLAPPLSRNSRRRARPRTTSDQTQLDRELAALHDLESGRRRARALLKGEPGSGEKKKEIEQ